MSNSRNKSQILTPEAVINKVNKRLRDSTLRTGGSAALALALGLTSYGLLQAGEEPAALASIVVGTVGVPALTAIERRYARITCENTVGELATTSSSHRSRYLTMEPPANEDGEAPAQETFRYGSWTQGSTFEGVVPTASAALGALVTALAAGDRVAPGAEPGVALMGGGLLVATAATLALVASSDRHDGAVFRKQIENVRDGGH